MAEASRSARATWWKHVEPYTYAFVAAAITLWVATRFYASIRLQTLHALHWANPQHFDELVASGKSGPWSAPLDDVFIHFDFARSAARGFPFQWSEGNGYSSGGTSLLYPFVLALGYWAGFRELRLMEWAAVSACVCTLAVLLVARRFARELPRPVHYILPFGFLSVGVLDWSLFSGMEVALLLALWVAAYAAYDDMARWGPSEGANKVRMRAALLGLCCGLVTATRPEGIVAVLVLAIAAALALGVQGRRRQLEIAVITLALPGVVLAGHAIANRVFTGESTAAGALVKLEAHHPYLTRSEVWGAWLFHVKYQILRVTQYHFGDRAAYGWLVWLFAACALPFRSTRPPAMILLASAISWIAIVATNGQVRWQNERYSMPAVAWLVLCAALGVAALLTRAYELRRRIRGPLMACATLAGVAVFVIHQAPRFREQLWFFGRASRNILDQHVRVGTRIRFDLQSPPHRVLVGDAGAIPYVSDLPALDIIGLGGYHDLPFARATREHVGAALELIERITPGDRPDLLAIYPGWWGDFPLWFGTRLAEVPVRGNVICGGASKVLYRPDWSPFEGSARPFTLRAGQRVVAEVDVADLVSERVTRYRVDGSPGYVGMKLLSNPENGRPLWDAGRVVAAGASESFRIGGLQAGRRLRWIVRAAPTRDDEFEVFVGGTSLGALQLRAGDKWREESVGPFTVNSSEIEVRFAPSKHERQLHHVWLVEEP